MKALPTILASALSLAFALAAAPVAANPDKSQLPAGHPPISAAKAPAVDLKGIQKAKDGKTVQEIITGATGLNGKKVAVRGKVVKVNTGIMGKTWIHLADGSGPNADLTITTAATPKVGDLVVATGTIAANKDFGAGYKYAVIMEDAAIKAE